MENPICISTMMWINFQELFFLFLFFHTRHVAIGFRKFPKLYSCLMSYAYPYFNYTIWNNTSYFVFHWVYSMRNSSSLLAFDNFILPSKKFADVIIPRGGENHVAIDLIVQHIRTKLGQHDLCKIYPNVNVIHSTFQVFVIIFFLFFTFA